MRKIGIAFSMTLVITMGTELRPALADIRIEYK
jgi:hypothetical protein